MSEIVGNEKILLPAWEKCPKCMCEKIIVEETGHYSETHLYGSLIGRNIDFGKLGPTTTYCSKCGYEEGEDVN